MHQPAQPEFGYTILYVASVPDTIGFYERAFGFANSSVHESGQYAELQTGATRLAFASHALTETSVPFRYEVASPERRPAVEITLTTPEVDALHARALVAGATELAAPHDTPWGQRVSYVSDPNGFAVALGTPMGA